MKQSSLHNIEWTRGYGCSCSSSREILTGVVVVRTSARGVVRFLTWRHCIFFRFHHAVVLNFHRTQGAVDPIPRHPDYSPTPFAVVQWSVGRYKRKCHLQTL